MKTKGTVLKKRLIVIGFSLVLLTSGTALAVKPEKPPKVDLEAMIETETQERIDADNGLTTAIDDNAQYIISNNIDINHNVFDIGHTLIMNSN